MTLRIGINGSGRIGQIRWAYASAPNCGTAVNRSASRP